MPLERIEDADAINVGHLSAENKKGGRIRLIEIDQLLKNKSARRGAQFVPIGMPTTC
jgi:hypothetical protein